MTVSLFMLAAGALLLISGVRGKTLAEVLRGEVGTSSNPDTGFSRIFDVQAFRERAAVQDSQQAGGGSQGFADRLGLGGTAGGAKGIVERAARIAAQHGDIHVISGYRPGAVTTSGNKSDHSQNDENRAARDLSNGEHPTPEMDAAVEDIAASMGQKVDGTKAVVKTFHYQGYRIQILYRTQVGGDHSNHIHVGARKD